MDLRTAALAYLRRGWSIIPMQISAKKPAVKWKRYQRKTAHINTVRRWFSPDSDHGLAVIFGAVSGWLASRDFDQLSAYERWAEAHPDLAKSLPTVATSRGRHVYFQVESSVMAEIRSQLGKPGTGAIHLDDGELRAGVGCYSVLPPSIHPSGRVYEWVVRLPDGALPVVDPVNAGFVVLNNATERDREHRVDRGLQRRTEAIKGEGIVVKSSDDMADREAPLGAEIEQAIKNSLPTGSGIRNKQVFELARALKAIPSLTDADARGLKPIVKRWHELAKPVIITQPFEETWIDFLNAWPKVKFPSGTEPMARIVEAAKTADVPAVAEQFEQEGLRFLVSLCWQLQRASGERPFYLSCRTAAKHTGVDHKCAWRWLGLLEYEKILGVVSKGKPGGGKATRYRYLAE